jgi:flagellar basal body rod protein FlgB
MAGLRLFDFTHQLLELSMRVRGARHEVLSANIANADTMLSGPQGFEAAVYEPSSGGQRHGEERLDGNRVSLDRQIALLNENALSYEANLTLFSRTLAKLRYVISDGRS